MKPMLSQNLRRAGASSWSWHLLELECSIRALQKSATSPEPLFRSTGSSSLLTTLVSRRTRPPKSRPVFAWSPQLNAAPSQLLACLTQCFARQFAGKM